MSATILGSSLLGSSFLGTNIPNNPTTSFPSQGGGDQTSSQGGGSQPSSQGMNSQPSSQGTISQQPHTMDGPTPSFPYLASLNVPYLAKLTNYPIFHDPTWTKMFTKLTSDIPKFEGKLGGDPSNHIMKFHLWLSSNSSMEDSIHLRLF